MKPMATKPIKTLEMIHKKDIISIIESCYRSNVSEFQYNGLVLRFHQSEVSPPKVYDYSRKPSKKDDFMSTVDEDIRKQAEEAKMLIESPSEYEELMIDSHMS